MSVEAKSIEKAKVAERNKQPAFSCEFSNVTFKSQCVETFRTKASSGKEGVTLWIESKKSKHQWQTTVTNVSDCGPSGIPEGAVYAFLQVKVPPLQLKN